MDAHGCSCKIPSGIGKHAHNLAECHYFLPTPLIVHMLETSKHSICGARLFACASIVGVLLGDWKIPGPGSAPSVSPRLTHNTSPNGIRSHALQAQIEAPLLLFWNHFMEESLEDESFSLASPDPFIDRYHLRTQRIVC